MCSGIWKNCFLIYLCLKANMYVSRSSHGRSRMKCSKEFFKLTFLVMEKSLLNWGRNPFLNWVEKAEGQEEGGGGREEQSQKAHFDKIFYFRTKCELEIISQKKWNTTRKTFFLKLSWKGWRSRDQSQEQTYMKLRKKGWKSNGEVGRDQTQEQQEVKTGCLCYLQ